MKIESESLLNQEIKTLKMKLREAENMKQRLKYDYEEVVNDSE